MFLQELHRSVLLADVQFLRVIDTATMGHGLTTATAFAHFDVLGLGIVTQEQFSKGVEVCVCACVRVCLLLCP